MVKRIKIRPCKSLVGAGVLSEEAGPHFLEALLLISGDFFARLRLSLWRTWLGVRFGASATPAADDIYYRNHNRAALRLLKQVVRDVVFELGLETVEIDTLETLLDGSLELLAETVHDLFIVSHIYEATADDVRAGHQSAALFVDG